MLATIGLGAAIGILLALCTMGTKFVSEMNAHDREMRAEAWSEAYLPGMPPD